MTATTTLLGLALWACLLTAAVVTVRRYLAREASWQAHVDDALAIAHSKAVTCAEREWQQLVRGTLPPCPTQPERERLPRPPHHNRRHA
jgi:hypothetical protein